MADVLTIHDQRTLTGVRVVTRLAGERYVSEAWYEDALLGRAENTDRFFAGMAHGAFLLSWAGATIDNLKDAAQQSRDEGYVAERPDGAVPSVTWGGDTAVVGLVPVVLRVYPDGDGEGWFASLDLPGGAWIPGTPRGAPAPTREAAREAAEATLRERFDHLRQALAGLVNE